MCCFIYFMLKWLHFSIKKSLVRLLSYMLKWKRLAETEVKMMLRRQKWRQHVKIVIPTSYTRVVLHPSCKMTSPSPGHVHGNPGRICKNIRIFSGCEVWIENSITRVTVRHHEACWVMLNSHLEGRNFQFAPNNHYGLVFFLRQLHLSLNKRYFMNFTQKISSFTIKKYSVELLHTTSSKHFEKNDIIKLMSKLKKRTSWHPARDSCYNRLMLVSQAEIPICMQEKWAAARQNQQNDLCIQRRRWSTWASAQSVFAVCMKKHWALNYILSTQWRLWSDWADAPADLSLCWVHMSFCWLLCSGSNSILSWKRYHPLQVWVGDGLKLRNRTALAVNCWVINHCFVVSCRHITTALQTVIYYSTFHW